MQIQTILRAAYAPLVFLLLMWSGFLLQYMGFISRCEGAIIPLVPSGLKGILFSPFLHANLDHIVSNSLPIGALLFLLFFFYRKMAPSILLYGTLLTGLLVWLLPPMDIYESYYDYTCVIGASGVAYMLAFFMFFSGVFRKNPKLLTISLLVALYFGSMIWGIFPEEFFKEMREPSRISWQSHFAGAAVGIILSWFYKGIGEKRKRFVWEYPNYYSERDDKLWQAYQENNPEDFAELPKAPRNDIWKHLDEIRKNT